jgi:hypothetical protein
LQLTCGVVGIILTKAAKRGTRLLLVVLLAEASKSTAERHVDRLRATEVGASSLVGTGPPHTRVLTQNIKWRRYLNYRWPGASIVVQLVTIWRNPARSTALDEDSLIGS